MSVLSSRLAPGFIRLRYSGVTQPHNQVIPINFASTPVQGVEPDLMTTGGTPIPFVTAINAWIDTGLAPSFNTATQFGFADIYAVNSVTGIRTFIYTTTPTTAAGTSASANVPLTEGIFVFKTSVGKPLKVYVMEGVYNPDERSVGTVPADGRQDIVDYILSPENFFYGRDDAWPLAFQTFTSKVNDSLRRREGFSGL